MTAPRGYRAFHIVAMLFVTTLLVSDVVSVKLVQLWSLTSPAGIVIFPLSLILGDVLTEVYGYSRARSVIVCGLVCQALLVLVLMIVVRLPPASFWRHQDAYSLVFHIVPRMVAAGLAAYFVGELVNSFILARMKIAYRGRHFWWRALASTIAGQGIDSVIFNVLAFAGVISVRQLVWVCASGWSLKVLYEVACLPITVRVTSRLKTIEETDSFEDPLGNASLLEGQRPSM